MLSRMDSAGNLRGVDRQYNLFSGSFAWAADWWSFDNPQVRDNTISRIRASVFQSNSTSLVANLSNSSGCEGDCPETPKLSGVSTSGRPIRCSQMRLAQTRAVRVFCSSVIQCASSSRPDCSGLISGAVEPANMLGTLRLISWRGSSSSPRARNRL